MNDVHYYETDVIWKEQRKGEISAPGLINIEVATPPEFSKGHPGIWSPEHLFVASANVCLMTTFLAIAELSKLEFTSFKSKAIGKLEKVDNKYQISEITLKPEIVINFEKDIDRAKRIIEKSEANCLISNSMKSKIILEPTIIVKES